MKVGFFLQGDNPAYHEMAKRTLESVREAMPGVEVHHLTDDYTPKIEGLDSTRVFYGDMPMAVRRMMHHAACEGEWLFIDCDCIVRKDVRHVFDEPFDVALTDREGTITNETRYAAVMPHNIGVTFSRSPAFWLTVVKYLQTMAAEQQEWEGDQQVVNAMVKAGGMGFNIKTLPGLLYNYPPRSEDDPRTADASIVHYKGARKQYLLKEAA